MYQFNNRYKLIQFIKLQKLKTFTIYVFGIFK